jgi:hypothetical protein
MLDFSGDVSSEGVNYKSIHVSIDENYETDYGKTVAQLHDESDVDVPFKYPYVYRFYVWSDKDVRVSIQSTTANEMSLSGGPMVSDARVYKWIGSTPIDKFKPTIKAPHECDAQGQECMVSKSNLENLNEWKIWNYYLGKHAIREDEDVTMHNQLLALNARVYQAVPELFWEERWGVYSVSKELAVEDGKLYVLTFSSARMNGQTCVGPATGILGIGDKKYYFSSAEEGVVDRHGFYFYGSGTMVVLSFESSEVDKGCGIAVGDIEIRQDDIEMN